MFLKVLFFLIFKLNNYLKFEFLLQCLNARVSVKAMIPHIFLICYCSLLPYPFLENICGEMMIISKPTTLPKYSLNYISMLHCKTISKCKKEPAEMSQ